MVLTGSRSASAGLGASNFAESPPMQIHQLSAADAVASLNSSPRGLSSAQAARRLAEYGPNRVEEVAGEPMLLRFLKEFTHFFALILWLAAALAFLAEWSDPGQGMAKVGYAILVVILVSGLFSFWQEFRVERTLAALRELLPQQVDVLRDGKAVRLHADCLVPGEIVLLAQGNNIPADCRLIEAFGVRVNDGATNEVDVDDDARVIVGSAHMVAQMKFTRVPPERIDHFLRALVRATLGDAKEATLA